MGEWMWPVGMSGDPGGRIIWVRAVWKSRGTRLRRGLLVSGSTFRTILAQDVLYYVPSPVLTTRFGHFLCSLTAHSLVVFKNAAQQPMAQTKAR